MAIRRYHVEIVTAAGTGVLGLISVIGATAHGHGWTETGPEAGYFPFYIGWILFGASLWNLIATVVHQPKASTRGGSLDDMKDPFLNRESALRLTKFLGGIFAFVVLTLFLGIYVGTVLYLTLSAWRQGGYHPLVSISIGVVFAITLYFIFEVLFQMPLLKGPIEPLLGIY